MLLNNDVIAREGWLEALQFGAHAADDVGVLGPMLLYPDGRIQSAGSHRNPGAPEWFDHRYRFAPASHGPAQVIVPCIAVTGACMYIRADALADVGLMDEAFGMAYEDVDWCLRCWRAGYRVLYYPAAVLTHLESQTRGEGRTERELAAQRYFWEKWGEAFDRRPVRAPDGGLRIVYVTEDTGVGGGHRVVFEHLNGLAARGHHPELWTLTGPPDWFDLDVPVRTFSDYEELTEALEPLEAVKVATWWNTAGPVWRSSVLNGIPVYFVQDIETSYYPAHAHVHRDVLASYRQEFRFLTTSQWVADRLRELGLEPAAVAPGVNLATFHPLADVRRAEDVVLALGRSQPLKNFPLTVSAYETLPSPRPQLWLFGVEPELAVDGARYHEAPDDATVNRLYNTATVFLQTSQHEGFCLPLLEAMATGAPVVCTDAHGNRDFCRDGENCLLVGDDPGAVAAAIARLLGDAQLRTRLGEAGRRTAERYAWDVRLDELARFYEELAGTPAQV